MKFLLLLLIGITAANAFTVVGGGTGGGTNGTVGGGVSGGGSAGLCGLVGAILNSLGTAATIIPGFASLITGVAWVALSSIAAIVSAVLATIGSLLSQARFALFLGAYFASQILNAVQSAVALINAKINIIKTELGNAAGDAALELAAALRAALALLACVLIAGFNAIVTLISLIIAAKLAVDQQIINILITLSALAAEALCNLIDSIISRIEALIAAKLALDAKLLDDLVAALTCLASLFQTYFNILTSLLGTAGNGGAGGVGGVLTQALKVLLGLATALLAKVQGLIGLDAVLDAALAASGVVAILNSLCANINGTISGSASIYFG